MPEWAPQPDWRFAFGARNGFHAENHYIQALVLEVGSLVDDVAVPVQLTSNGQQYSAGGVQYIYYGLPTLSEVSPALGPGAPRPHRFSTRA